MKRIKINKKGRKVLFGVNVIIFMFLMVMIRLFNMNIKTLAVSENPREKIVKSIRVEKDCTLWDYAVSYYTDDYGSVECYINEIKRTNGLQEDTIHKNAYLLIPYYDNYKK